MNDSQVIAIAGEALWTALLVSAPILVVTLVIGIVISIFQAMTQVNEATLTFVPKLLGVFAISAVMGPWMVGTMVQYTYRLFATLPQAVR
jgi:flagellar biosynthetic protein FliQ